MKVEILSPSGDKDSFIAALRGGADAVYLGGPRFSARAYANNFTKEDLIDVIRQAKNYDMKVYVTINTLIKDEELYDAYKYSIEVWNLGVDAIIIQDTGLISLLNKFNPNIELHASTQMTIHNLKGAEFARYMGIKRVVLAREMSLKEIEAIAREVESEIFIQGALCISYSGKCLMSSLNGGRSGNRGRCSQSCRMKYDFIDGEDKLIKKGYLLSPKDLNTLDLMDELIDTGVASLKIEGRMKRAEYVFEAVRQYKRARDKKDYNKENLLQLFNREGATSAFLKNNPGKDLMAWNNPKNRGLYLGRSKNGKIKLQRSLSLGDGLATEDDGFIVTKIVRGKDSVKEAEIGDMVTIYPNKYREDMDIYKTSDSILMKEIEKAIKIDREKAYKLNLKVKFHPGENILLEAFAHNLESTYKSPLVKVLGPIVEKALKSPLDEEGLLKNFNKTGDYPFDLGKVEFDIGEGFLRLSSLNEVRRELYDEIKDKILNCERREKVESQEEISNYLIKKLKGKYEGQISNKNEKGTQKIYSLLTRKEHLDLYLNEFKEKIVPILYPFLRQENSLNKEDISRLEDLKVHYWIKAPEILKSEFNDFITFIRGLKYLKGLLTDNLGVIKEVNDNFNNLEIMGDYKLNIFNSYGEIPFKGVSTFTLSEELNKENLENIIYKDNKVLLIYGRQEMMLSEYCPIGSVIGGRSMERPCSLPCLKGEYFLKDRLEERYPIKSDIWCRSYILNSKVKNLTNHIREIEKMGYQNYRCDFWDEDGEEMRSVISKILKGEGAQITGSNLGHYKLGVE